MFNGYCLILKKEIEEGNCVDILYELMGLKKEEEIKFIKRYKCKGISNKELKEICKECPNSPPEFRDDYAPTRSIIRNNKQ